ncbi:MAG: hypothetical protein AAGC44_04150 [Planctomycetota bacterium]
MSPLKRQESIEDGCRRLVCESIETAIRELTRKDGSTRAAAESVRQADAGIALIESELPREVTRRDRRLLDRIAAEIASALRPGLLLKHYDKLAGAAGVSIDSGQGKAFRKALARSQVAGLSMNAPNRSFDPIVYRLVADLAELRGQVGDWPVFEPDPARPPIGLRRAYTHARRDAQLVPAPAEHAASRLRTLELHLAFLNRCCPAMVKPHRKLIQAAAEQLDQRATRSALAEMLTSTEKSDWAKPLLDKLNDPSGTEDTTKLLAQAFAESPAAFNNRIAAYWRSWRAD